MFHCGSYFSTNARHGKLVANRGFTLIELVVSLLIISAAVVTVLPNLSQAVRMSAQAKTTVTAIQLARNLLNEIQLDPKRITEGKQDGKFEDFENYYFEYEIEKVKLEDIMIAPPDESNSAGDMGVKKDLNVERLYKIQIKVLWEVGIRNYNYDTHSFIYKDEKR